MTQVLFVDTNVPIYATGRDHPYKEPCAAIIRIIATNPTRFVTDAEVFQELMHYYLRTNRWATGREVFGRFETLLQGRIEPTYLEDVRRASQMADDIHQVGSRDLVHASVMSRIGTSLIISSDADFDRIPALRRLDPVLLSTWTTELQITEP